MERKKRLCYNGSSQRKREVVGMEQKKRNKKNDRQGKERASANSSGCPYAKKCGGRYQGVSYEKQLKEKQRLVQKYVGGFCR